MRKRESGGKRTGDDIREVIMSHVIRPSRLLQELWLYKHSFITSEIFLDLQRCCKDSNAGHPGLSKGNILPNHV